MLARPNPLWTKAPLLLLRLRGLLVALLVGALLLALALASPPLFVSSAGSEALEIELEDTTRFGAGVSIQQELFAGSRGLSGLSALVDEGKMRRVLADVPQLEAPVMSVLGPLVVPGRPGRPSAQLPVRLLAKSGALAHVDKLAGRDGNGVWIADPAARSLGVEPGDSISLSLDGSAGGPQVRVDGVYRALWREPSTPYWRSLSRSIYARSADAGPPPTFVIADLGRLLVLAGETGDRGLEVRWEWPLRTTALSLEEAERLQARVERFQQAAQNPETAVGRALRCAQCPGLFSRPIMFSSLLSLAVTEAKETVATLRTPADLLAITGTLVALAVVGAAAAFSLGRRRAEARLLFARGMSPTAFGGKAALESVAPVVVGAALGVPIAIALVAAIGPGSRLDPAAMLDAALLGAVAVPLALASIGIVSALLFSKQSERPPRLRLPAWLPWELPVLALSAYLYVRLRGQQTGADGAGPPPLSLLLFPLTFVGACAGLAARGLTRPLRRLAAHSGAFPGGAHLAAHRLAGSGRLPLILVAACGLSIGIFLYAQSIVGSLGETLDAKAHVFVGSDVQGVTSANREIPPDFPLPATKVIKVADRATVGGGRVDLLAVDPKTIAGAAYWDDSWSSSSPAQISRDLRDRPGQRLPILIAGKGLLNADVIELTGAEVPVEVVARARAFPGMSFRRPLVVADAAAIERLAAAAGVPNPLRRAGIETEIWVRGPTEDAVAALASARNLRPFPILTAEEVRRESSNQAVAHTLAFLRSLGIAAALLAGVGLVLYAQARQRARTVSYAFARRMGLPGRSHRTAVALELGGLLAVSLVLGSLLGTIAARAVIGEIDPRPTIPPPPLFRIPVVLIALLPAALLLVAFTGARLADRSARRANLAEVMRVAE